jgi:ABC-type transport system involved in multi-copper enzyme maturation permease subunit
MSKRANRVAWVLDNPIAVREWRMLRRRVGNWRAWVGMKWPLDPIMWGAPIILTFTVAPYGLWAVLASLRGLHVIGSEKVPLGSLSLLALAFWFYVMAISLILGATAITHEREQERWDQLRLTVLSRRERGTGFLFGRLGPIWASGLATAALWWMLLPSYLALLTAPVKAGPARRALALGTLITFVLSLLMGEIGLLASARFKSTAVAVVMAMLFAFPFALVGALILGANLSTGGDFYKGVPASDRRMHTLSLLVFSWFFVSVCIVVRDAMEERLEA